jgi:hypothetical protein
MPEAVAHRGELANRLVEIICLRGELLAVKARAVRQVT